jgi:hypothetical protein
VKPALKHKQSLDRVEQVYAAYTLSGRKETSEFGVEPKPKVRLPRPQVLPWAIYAVSDAEQGVERVGAACRGPD